jgi:putative ABC transport system permease protein
MQLVRLIFKNIRRNLLRTALAASVIFVLVMGVTLIWSVVVFLDQVTVERSKDLKAIVTERWQIPSQMPLTYLEPLSRGAARSAQDVRPDDYMSWQFVGGSTDPNPRNRTPSTTLFFFAMDPAKLAPMMDDLNSLDPALIRKMQEDKQATLIGSERLQKLGKKIGERLRIYCFNYKDIQLDLNIVGTFPDGRYNDSAVMNYRYLVDALDDFQVKNKKPHEMAQKTLNLVWLRVPDSQAFGRVAEQVESAVEFRDRPVRCETASSGVASFIEAYRDFIRLFRWLVVPSMLAIMALITSIVISIGVRERQVEMAVLKVLGFLPWQILVLVLGEALVVAGATGSVSACFTYFFVLSKGGFKFPIAFFPSFLVPAAALWWGPLIGCLTALVGSLAPAWLARSVKASEVFAKVT